MTTSSQPIAVITGGARGIGRQLATDLLARGYRVVIGDLDQTATDATAAELGAGASAVRLDVTDRKNLATVVAHVEATVGPIALWINNAGIMPTGPFRDQKMDVARAIIDINYAGVVEGTAAVLPGMLERHAGTIVNLASATGIKPLAGVAVYSGTKAAVIAFTQSLRRELRGTGVRLIVVSPNLVRTALGAGITPPRLTGVITAPMVSAAIMAALDHPRRFSIVVPRRLAPVLRLSNSLPIRLRDWVDDRAGSDEVGLGGDPTVREQYLSGVLGKAKKG
jgi:NADP-dependent 3-hydroxy acid dehydrogenase YdfG